MKDDRVYLQHIRDAIADVLEYASAGQAAFYRERMRQDAVVRKLEVIGEAVKNLSEATKARASNLPWRQIAGMRDKMIHEYFGVNLDIVWAVVESELPKLRVVIDELLRDRAE